jgi:hypothetical protein
MRREGEVKRAFKSPIKGIPLLPSRILPNPSPFEKIQQPGSEGDHL